AAKQPVSDTRRAPRAGGDLSGSVGIDLYTKDACGAGHDPGELRSVIELHLGREAEAVTEGTCEHASASRRADERERSDLDGDRRRSGPLTDDDVDAEVLHRHVQHFLGWPRHAVDLVDEEDVALHEVRQHRRQVPCPLECRPRGHSQRGTELLGYDHRHRRLTQPWWTGKQHVVGRNGTAACPAQYELKLLTHFRLANKLRQALRAKRAIELGVSGNLRPAELIIR